MANFIVPVGMLILKRVVSNSPLTHKVEHNAWIGMDFRNVIFSTAFQTSRGHFDTKIPSFAA